MSNTAGPSTPRYPVPPTPASTDETDAISASLDSRRKTKRRNSSIFSSIARGKSNVKNKVIPPERPVVIEDEDEFAENERKSYEKKAGSEYEAILNGKMDPIDVKEEDVVEAEQGERSGKAKKQEYVWDVLFENQRGIYLAGKAYFSSRTLLPADPSPFTLPSSSLPSASSFTVSKPSNDARPSEQPVKTTAQAQHARRTIETGYTLDTFQTPSPDWVWMTPWMINMRTGTDEGGWRYNCWFRGKGWKSHAGMAGWAGWVRRREWVRLRTLAAEEKVLEPPMEPEEVEPGERLHVLLDEKGIDGVIKALAKLPLDRKKMETWERWLENDDEEDKRKLQMALDDSEAVQTISKTFTYQSSIPSLFSLFAAHNLAIPSQTDSASSSSVVTPGADESRFHATSHHPHPHSTSGTKDSRPDPDPSLTSPRGTPSASPAHDTDD